MAKGVKGAAGDTAALEAGQTAVGDVTGDQASAGEQEAPASKAEGGEEGELEAPAEQVQETSSEDKAAEQEREPTPDLGVESENTADQGAAPAPTEPEAAEVVPVIKVRSVSPKGRRRAGFAFGPQVETIPIALLSEADIERIENDPLLISVREG